MATTSLQKMVDTILVCTTNWPISNHSRIIFPCLIDRDGEIEQPDMADVAQSKTSLSSFSDSDLASLKPMAFKRPHKDYVSRGKIMAFAKVTSLFGQFC